VQAQRQLRKFVIMSGIDGPTHIQIPQCRAVGPRPSSFHTCRLRNFNCQQGVPNTLYFWMMETPFSRYFDVFPSSLSLFHGSSGCRSSERFTKSTDTISSMNPLYFETCFLSPHLNVETWSDQRMRIRSYWKALRVGGLRTSPSPLGLLQSVRDFESE
jgi:hypothetical protein